MIILHVHVYGKTTNSEKVHEFETQIVMQF